MAWAMITGASRGLGLELARQAAAAGYDLVLSDMDAEALSAADLRAEGRQVVTLVADLAAPGAAQALWAQASQGREIEVLINNAGLGRHGHLGTEAGGGLARDRAVVAVNIAALTDLMALALGPMRARGRGYVLNIASIAAWMPAPNLATYHASKSYVLSLSRAVRDELRGTGVSVTALCPGPIDTGFFAASGTQDTRILRFMAPMAPARVARIGWRALMHRRAEVIPGLLNRLTVYLSHISYKPLVTRISGWLWNR